MNRLCVLLLSLSVVSAEPRLDEVAKRLLGAWRLVSVEGTDATTHLAFDRPTGMIVYDRSGRMTPGACRNPISRTELCEE